MVLHRESNLYKDLKRTTLLTTSEERELITLAQKGDNEARNRLILRNLGFAIKVARRHEGVVENDDLIQEAIIGLIEAVRKFNLSLPYRFTTFARWCIRSRLADVISTSGMIRIPRPARQQAKKLEQALATIGTHCSDEDLCRYFGWNITKKSMTKLCTTKAAAATRRVNSSKRDELFSHLV